MDTNELIDLGVAPGVSNWLAAKLPEVTLPLTYRRLTGGRSNLTFLVSDSDGHRWVLRRPPLGDHPKTAHDVVREARLLAGVAGDVPVPAVIAVCEDITVTGAPFVVLEYLDGLALRDPAGVEASLTVAERAAVGPALIDALVALHRVDPARLGLGKLAERRDHVSRQLHRWEENWRRTATRALPDLQQAHALLSARIPEQERSTIVHGDFRLDNCLIDRTGRVHGVLDWELATLGDPLVDLGQFLVYWAEPGDKYTALYAPPTTAPGFTSREELHDQYFQLSGRPVISIDFYLALNWWKTACIVENVYSRMRNNAMGASDRTPESFGEQAAGLAAQALSVASRLA